MDHMKTHFETVLAISPLYMLLNTNTISIKSICCSDSPEESQLLLCSVSYFSPFLVKNKQFQSLQSSNSHSVSSEQGF